MSSESRPTEKLGFDDCTVPDTGVSLAGVAEDLAVTWETGDPKRHPDLARTRGAEDDWELATMLSIGYPDEDPPSRRTLVSNYVRWLE